MLKNALRVLFTSIILLAAQVQADSSVQVLLTTDHGDIKLELYPDKAPVTVENFINYVNGKHYDGLIFHRVMKGFVIQAGGFKDDLTRREPSGKAIVNESFNGLSNTKGTIAMARQTDPDSAKAQFYINMADNWTLNPRNGKPGYTVFGKIIQGTNVADKISRQPITSMGPFANLPETPIHIIKAQVIGNE